MAVVGSGAVRSGAEDHRVVASQTAGERGHGVADEVTDDGSPASVLDRGFLAAGAVHSGDVVTLGMEQCDEAAADASGCPDLEDATGGGGPVSHVGPIVGRTRTCAAHSAGAGVWRYR